MNFEDLFRQKIPMGEAAAFFIGIKKFASPMNEFMACARASAPNTGTHVYNGSKMAAADPREEAEVKAIKSLQGGVGSALHTLSRRDVLDQYQKSERGGDLAGRVLGGAAGLATGAAGGGKQKALAGAAGAAVGQHLGGKVGRYFGINSDVKRFREGFKKKAEELQITEGKAPGKGLGVSDGLLEDTETFNLEDLQKQTPKLVVKKSVGFLEKRAMFKRALEQLGFGEPGSET